MVVVKVADEDVAGKIDTQFIAEQFTHVENVSIVFICTSEGGQEDEWIDNAGMRHIVIVLPHKMVGRMKDARPLMLRKARKRLRLPG